MEIRANARKNQGNSPDLSENARVITGDPYEIRSIDILKKLEWKTLRERRKEQQPKYVSKALTCQCPKHISDMFKLSNSVRYELRSNNNKLMLSKPKTNSMKRNVFSVMLLL
jgi:hypothetical protein